MTDLEKALMNRDGLSLKEAKETVEDIREEFMNGNMDALFDYGFEDDYIFDVLM